MYIYIYFTNDFILIYSNTLLGGLAFLHHFLSANIGASPTFTHWLCHLVGTVNLEEDGVLT